MTRVPTPQEVDEFRRQVAGLAVDTIVKQGMRLSELIEQDSYSYDMAHLYLGADSQSQLLNRYTQAVRALPFEFDDGDYHLPVPDV